MKAIQSTIAAAAIALGVAVPASAATTDPEVIIYRFPGVSNDGVTNNNGVTTVFHCTNFSGAAENVRFVTRSSDGGLRTNIVFTLLHLATLTASTHPTNAYGSSEQTLGILGPLTGTTAIAATSTNIICTAMTIDASTAAPIGVALRGIRFSPVPGSQE